MTPEQKQELKKFEKLCKQMGESKESIKNLVQIKKEEMKFLNNEFTDDHIRCNICGKNFLKKSISSHNKSKYHLKKLEENKV